MKLNQWECADIRRLLVTLWTCQEQVKKLQGMEAEYARYPELIPEYDRQVQSSNTLASETSVKLLRLSAILVD